MNILENAYLELYPDKEIHHTFSMHYSGRFRGYNAHIRMNRTEISVHASKQWETVSHEIQKGLCQELLIRLFKTKRHTLHRDLYHQFLKNLSTVTPATRTHPILLESFQRVNDSLLFSTMEQPNLKLGRGINRLGTYEYATNTITISRILLEHPELMDYVMYHEMLHKKHQFTSHGLRCTHHSTAFRNEEAKFPRAAELEKELALLVRAHKRKKRFFW